MVDHRTLFLVIVFFLFSVVSSDDTVDPLIRQVVDGKGLGAEHHFSEFKRKFGKVYATEEEHGYRFNVFKANMRRARRHQLMDPSAVHGMTQFSDMTPMEFRHSVLGLRGLRLPYDANKAPLLPTDNLPSDFDWREHTTVKNQYNTEDEATCDSSCNSGLMNNEEDYPSSGTESGSGTSKFDRTKIVASVVSFDEDQIAANLVKNGPLAVAINAVYMQTYVGGVSCPYICSRSMDHGALLVGYGSGSYASYGEKLCKPYWIIKNSWGENWGENGYYKICRTNICGVGSMVSTVAALHTTRN